MASPLVVGMYIDDHMCGANSYFLTNICSFINTSHMHKDKQKVAVNLEGDIAISLCMHGCTSFLGEKCHMDLPSPQFHCFLCCSRQTRATVIN